MLDRQALPVRSNPMRFDMEIDVPGRELVVTFRRDGEVLDEFYCTGGTTAVTMLARGLLALRPVLQPGDVLSVEWRRRPNLIERGLG
jgi:hypothetical protein